MGKLLDDILYVFTGEDPSDDEELGPEEEPECPVCNDDGLADTFCPVCGKWDIRSPDEYDDVADETDSSTRGLLWHCRRLGEEW